MGQCFGWASRPQTFQGLEPNVKVGLLGGPFGPTAMSNSRIHVSEMFRGIKCSLFRGIKCSVALNVQGIKNLSDIRFTMIIYIIIEIFKVQLTSYKQ